MFKVGDIVRLKDNKRNKDTPFWRDIEERGQVVDYDYLKISKMENRGEGVWLYVFDPKHTFGVVDYDLELNNGGPW